MSQKILNSTKTTRPTTTGLQRQWYILDASKEPLGRLAVKAADILNGKNRPDYAPDVDMGGVVVVINAEKCVLTGKKTERKNYFRHTGTPGGLTITSFAEQMEKDATRPVYHAIKKMLPRNRQTDNRANNRLHIVIGDAHTFSQKLIPAN